MERVLIVEDSRSTARMLARAIETQLDYSVDVAADLQQAEQYIQENPSEYFVALTDLNLPDAPQGQAVDLVLANNIPCVVVSASISEVTRKRVLALPIADYVVKRGPEDIQYLIRLVRRIHRNRKIKALVVDDSDTYRKQLKQYLGRQSLNVFEASNAEDGMSILKDNPDIRIVLLDYHMPGMNGVDMTKAIRRTHSPEELSVIAITVSSDELAPVFLKSGANDFVPKTSSFEELVCRLNMNLDMLELIWQNKELAERDSLTGLYNRRMLFDSGLALFDSGQGAKVSVAMLDIDHFKRVNDSYGHAGGDMALKSLAILLSRDFPQPALVARYGGEEFCILFVGEASDAVVSRLDAFREQWANTPVYSGNETFSGTLSIGYSSGPAFSFDDLVSRADQALYAAKNSGRNRLVCDGKDDDS